MKDKSSIFTAILVNDIAYLSSLLEKDPTFIKEKKNAEFTPLLDATILGHIELVQCLVETIQKHQLFDQLQACTFHGCNAVYLAAENGHVAILGYLLAQGIPYKASNNGTTPLHKAILNGHLQTVQFLVPYLNTHDLSAEVNATDSIGSNAVFWAAEKGHVTVLGYLLAQGIPYKANKSGVTPLHIASMHGHLQTVQFLVPYLNTHSLSAEVNATDSIGSNAVFWAAYHGHVRVLGYLLAQGIPYKANNNGFTPLHQASYNGHLQTVQLLMHYLTTHALSADINATDSNGSNAVFWAAYHGHVRVLGYLLAQGIPYKANNNGFTPLHQASYNGHLQTVQLLMHYLTTHALSADINATDSNGCNAVYWAAYQGHVTVLSYLLDQGIPYKANKSGVTPLHIASIKGHLQTVQFLVPYLNTHGLSAEVNATDSIGSNAVFWAAYQGHVRVLGYLLAQGIPYKASNHGTTPLHFAILNGHLQTVQFLIRSLITHDLSAEINSTDPKGSNAVFRAAEKGHVTVLGYLLAQGIPYKANKSGVTPLHIASMHGHLQTVQFLVPYLNTHSLSAEVNATDSIGSNAVFWAAYQGHVRVLGYLLAQGIPYKANNNGFTPLHQASYNGHLQTVQLLMHYLTTHALSADINATDSNGCNAVFWAAYQGHVTVLTYLLAQGIPYKANNSGTTPLHIASNKGHLQTIQFLVSYLNTHDLSAEVNAVDSNGCNAVYIAAEKGHVLVLNYLLAQGVLYKEDKDGITPLYRAIRGEHIDTVKLLLSDDEISIQEYLFSQNEENDAFTYAMGVDIKSNVKIVQLLLATFPANMREDIFRNYQRDYPAVSEAIKQWLSNNKEEKLHYLECLSALLPLKFSAEKVLSLAFMAEQQGWSGKKLQQFIDGYRLLLPIISSSRNFLSNLPLPPAIIMEICSFITSLSGVENTIIWEEIQRTITARLTDLQTASNTYSAEEPKENSLKYPVSDFIEKLITDKPSQPFSFLTPPITTKVSSMEVSEESHTIPPLVPIHADYREWEKVIKNSPAHSWKSLLKETASQLALLLAPNASLEEIEQVMQQSSQRPEAIQKALRITYLLTKYGTPYQREEHNEPILEQLELLDNTLLKRQNSIAFGEDDSALSDEHITHSESSSDTLPLPSLKKQKQNAYVPLKSLPANNNEPRQEDKLLATDSSSLSAPPSPGSWQARTKATAQSSSKLL